MFLSLWNNTNINTNNTKKTPNKLVTGNMGVLSLCLLLSFIIRLFFVVFGVVFVFFSFSFRINLENTDNIQIQIQSNTTLLIHKGN